MPNVKNRRIEVDGDVYRWSSIGGDGGIRITVRREEDGRQLGRRLESGVPHNVLVLPSVIRRLILQARGEGWRPEAEPHAGNHDAYRVVLQGPFLDAPDRRKKPRPVPEDHDEHLAAIRATPDDDAPRLVYADWLSERGDPRGELIVLQCGPQNEKTKAAARALLDLHATQWLGAVAFVTRSHVWERGFLAGAELTRRERGVVHAAIGDERWWSVRQLDARGAFLDPLDHAHIVAGAGFDDLETLLVDAATLEHLVKEDATWVPRKLVVSPPGAISIDVLAAAAAHLRLRQLVVTARGASADDLRTLERPGLVVSC